MQTLMGKEELTWSDRLTAGWAASRRTQTEHARHQRRAQGTKQISVKQSQRETADVPESGFSGT